MISLAIVCATLAGLSYFGSRWASANAPYGVTNVFFAVDDTLKRLAVIFAAVSLGALLIGLM
jgi:hypothetical protein